MIKSSEDKPTTTLRSPAFGEWFQRFSDGNQIAFNVAVGLIASLLTYIATVVIPERRKRVRLRRQLSNRYTEFKRNCLRTILSALKQQFDSQVVDQLLDKAECERFFGVQVSESQTRWHQFMNTISDEHLREFQFEIETLCSEIDFTMLAIDVENEELFEFLKHVKYVCRYRGGRASIDYDEVKALSRFLSEILTGWNVISGHKDRDKIESMIASL